MAAARRAAPLTLPARLPRAFQRSLGSPVQLGRVKLVGTPLGTPLGTLGRDDALELEVFRRREAVARAGLFPQVAAVPRKGGGRRQLCPERAAGEPLAEGPRASAGERRVEHVGRHRAKLVRERALEGDRVGLEYALELGAHGGGRLEGRDPRGGCGGVAFVVRAGAVDEASASAAASSFAGCAGRAGRTGGASRATDRIASKRAPRVHRPAPRRATGFETSRHLRRASVAQGSVCALTHATSPLFPRGNNTRQNK
mmetsp:Transcript_4579/g.20817  ORF Transcript_4579/g.20817 Transcript_4579/m.20817 type:complete len:256 (-) Transcript_4579:9-776(-)